MKRGLPIKLYCFNAYHILKYENNTLANRFEAAFPDNELPLTTLFRFLLALLDYRHEKKRKKVLRYIAKEKFFEK